jgi:seryl-tRNA synthetase
MTIEELEAKVAELERANLELTEKLRVNDELLTNALARVEDLIARDIPVNTDEKYWFGYKNKEATEQGAFDMRIVTSWTAVLIARKGWHATVYVGDVPHKLDPVFTQEFWGKFPRLLKGLL